MECEGLVLCSYVRTEVGLKVQSWEASIFMTADIVAVDKMPMEFSFEKKENDIQGLTMEVICTKKV